jgi:vacuolar-type H+-ATPase subunit H
MRDVIQGLLETESQAKQMVQSAREEAERLIADAQKRAQGLLAQTRAETRAQAETIVESAVNQAQAEKKQRLEKATEQVGTTVQLDPATKDQIVRAVVDSICGNAWPPPGGSPPRDNP